MKIGVKAMAGTLESNDVLVRVSPQSGGIEVKVESIVLRQFGEALKQAARQTAEALGASGVLIELDDKGAVDWTVRARVETALIRAQGVEA